jgi:hypothetical protein
MSQPPEPQTHDDVAAEMGQRLTRAFELCRFASLLTGRGVHE